MPSTPNCIMSDASATVAMPPAAKFTTGSLPSSATSFTSDRGTPYSLAFFESSLESCFMPDSRAISEFIFLVCLTASTTFPVPASPFVLIIAAPSFMRRSASPRFLHPHTNGILNFFLSMWCSSSAGVSTSDSSTMSAPSASRICASAKWPIRAFAMTGIVTVSIISVTFSGGDILATPPCNLMSDGTRSSAMTATAPASSAIFA